MCVVEEEFLQPLSASLGHGSCVPPSAGGAGGGRDEGDGIRVRGAWLGARTDLFAAVTDWFLALHVLALPSFCDLVTLCSMSIAENQPNLLNLGRSISRTLSRLKSGGGAAYLLAVAGLIACKDASLFEAFSCSWTPPATFYKLLEIERSSLPQM